MTPKQQQEANANAQKEAWLRQEKVHCRRIALDCALDKTRKTGGDTIAEAEKFYEWLTKDLE